MTKCKFWKKCEWYDEDSFACRNKGLYYDEGDSMRHAGCYGRKEDARINKR